MSFDKWVLIARNVQGACVVEKGETKKTVLDNFDRYYSRSGWKIEVSLNDSNAPVIYIKTTYR